MTSPSADYIHLLDKKRISSGLPANDAKTSIIRNRPLDVQRCETWSIYSFVAGFHWANMKMIPPSLNTGVV